MYHTSWLLPDMRQATEKSYIYFYLVSCSPFPFSSSLPLSPLHINALLKNLSAVLNHQYRIEKCYLQFSSGPYRFGTPLCELEATAEKLWLAWGFKYIHKHCPTQLVIMAFLIQEGCCEAGVRYFVDLIEYSFAEQTEFVLQVRVPSLYTRSVQLDLLFISWLNLSNLGQHIRFSNKKQSSCYRDQSPLSLSWVSYLQLFCQKELLCRYNK